MGMKCIGVDVGGTSVKMGIFETTGELLDKWEVKTRKEENGKYILPDVAASIREKVSAMGLDLKTDIAGAGLGVPGPVMPDGSVEVCVNLGWHHVNPQKELSGLLDGIPVKSGNDANVAALGEMWQGGGKGYSDIIMITLGTGVGGGVMPDGSVEVCVNLGWKNVNPQKELSALLDGIPVKSGNDANVAALGEMWQGGGKGYDNLVMITLGTGVGGGVILGQKIVAGRHGLAGEIGHIHVRDEEKEYCNCGGQGCLEQICSATGIAREARRKMAASETASVLRQYGDNVSAKNVLDAAKEGDELALEVMAVVSHYLGLALSQAALIADPDIFVIGGGVSKAGQFLIDMVQKDYDHFMTISKNKARLGLATLGNDAGIYGAARLIL